MTRPNLSILSHPLAHFINPLPRSTYRATPESSECSKDIEHLCSDSLGSTLHDDSIPSDGSANVRALTKPDKHKSCGATKSLRRFGSHAAQHSAAQRSTAQCGKHRSVGVGNRSAKECGTHHLGPGTLLVQRRERPARWRYWVGRTPKAT
jgi:hypothetical protein